MKTIVAILMLTGLVACTQEVREVRRPVASVEAETDSNFLRRGGSGAGAAVTSDGHAEARFVRDAQVETTEVALWEYRIHTQEELWTQQGGLRLLENNLNRLGEQGWNLVTISGSNYIFKRQATGY